MQFVIDLLAGTGLMPHGYCLLWSAPLILTHAGSDLVIAVAYFTIPVAIYRVLKSRTDITHPGIGYLFAAFILACAMTHVMALATLWFPLYTLQGIVKLACAIISGVTAIAVWRLLPTLISMPGPAAARRSYEELEKEILKREEAENNLKMAHAELRRANEELELHVKERTQALVEVNEELENFAYVASHDLRAPLRPLMEVPKWVRETLMEKYGEVPEEVDIDLSEMETHSRRMDKLLTDLLTYSRIGRTKDLSVEVDPIDLIEESIDLSGVPDGFKVDYPKTLPRITCIPTEFNLIMRNLINNAIKHHDSSKGTIRITGEAGPEKVEFTVTDDGPGIDAKFSDKIFEMFATLRPRDEVEGSGMGLTMVRKIVSKAGGSVSVGPNPEGRGSIFTVTFPGSQAMSA